MSTSEIGLISQELERAANLLGAEGKVHLWPPGRMFFTVVAEDRHQEGMKLLRDALERLRPFEHEVLEDLVETVQEAVHEHE